MPQYILAAADAVARAQQADLNNYEGLRPVIIGPRAGLHRYAVASEKALSALGDYDKLADQTYAYPGKASGSVVDQDYVKLYADNADLNYFTKLTGSGTGTVTPDATRKNRVRASGYVFKTGNDIDRSAEFYDRDVKVGDYATLTYGGDTHTSKVTGFVGETVAAVTDAATSDGANLATQAASATITQVAGTPVSDVVATASAASYESSADGYVNRTYTITVTQASTGSDATTALLRVRSSDGLDDDDDVAPAAFGSATSIGSKGATVTFSINTSNSSSTAGVDEDDFNVGQAWTLTVAGAFTAPVATSGGTYTGPRDTKYIVTVTRGGLYSATDKPQITVTTSNGTDSAGPLNVTAASTAFAVGNYGVTVSFSGTRLRKGDKYYIEVDAAAEGAYRTLVLQDDVPSAMLGQNVNLDLYARRSGVEIPRKRALPSPADNWSLDADSVTVEAGVYLTDSEFTNGGVQFGVALAAADLYLEYREWVTTGAGTVRRVNNPTDAAAYFGEADPDNPVGYAVYKALQNTAGELVDDPVAAAEDLTDVVAAAALGGDPADLALWTTALELFENDDTAYQIVPLSVDPDVHALVETHVAAQSADAEGFYRVAWLPATLEESGAVVSEDTTSDDLAATATVAAAPGITPTEYTQVTASSNAQFVTKGVRAGDVLRINYSVDALGETTYDEYVVEEVVSETVLRLETGPEAAVTSAVMIEVWRDYTKAEMVAQLTAKAAGFDSDRIRYVWPDRAALGGETLDGYYVCAALAGLAGSVCSHQGLRNVGLEGFDDATRSSRFFTAKQLDELAAGGVWVVSQTPAGEIYTRSAVTTDPTDASTHNEMVVRNADMVRKAVQAAWAPYVGSGNVVSNLDQLLRGALSDMSNRLTSGNYHPNIGAPVGAITLVSLETVDGSPDKVTATLSAAGLAVPLNQVRVVLPVTLG